MLAVGWPFEMDVGPERTDIAGLLRVEASLRDRLPDARRDAVAIGLTGWQRDEESLSEVLRDGAGIEHGYYSIQVPTRGPIAEVRFTYQMRRDGYVEVNLMVGGDDEGEVLALARQLTEQLAQTRRVSQGSPAPGPASPGASETV